MREISVIAIAPLIDASTADVRDALGDVRTLADALSWMRASSPRRNVEEIVTQDEYTHDVVVQYDEVRWLAFDTN